MAEKSYQNIDIPQNNPLNFPQAEDVVLTPKKKIPLNNPKIIILLVLGVIIIILLITSLVVSLLRQSTPKNTSTPTPTFTPSEIPLPTTYSSLIPSIYQANFKELEESFNHDIDLEPPVIDSEIGQ